MRDNKIILILGASSDVGCALIHANADNYSKIYAHYANDSKKLEEAKNKLGEKLVLVQADLTQESDVAKLIEEVERNGEYPDHIIHLPSLKAKNEKFHKCKCEDFESGWKISVLSIVMILQSFLPKMAKQHYGKIVFMLTSYVCNIPPKYQSVYVTHKYALLGLMKSLSVEYASKGIMVNGVSPEMMNTKFLDDIPEFVIEDHAAKSPLKRNLDVKDVIPTFQYLLSDGADTISGMNIAITAGE